MGGERGVHPEGTEGKGRLFFQREGKTVTKGNVVQLRNFKYELYVNTITLLLLIFFPCDTVL